MIAKAKLVRYSFPDDENWLVVDESTPLGTTYTIIDEKDGFVLHDKSTGKSRKVKCYLADGNGDVGWLPVDVFEIIGD